MTARPYEKPAVSHKSYSYVRFSTPEQREGDSQRRQIARAEEYAKRHGLELDTKVRFEDLGVSAFRGKNAKAGLRQDGKKPALAAFLERVEAGIVERGSTLLVENLDRISRQHPQDAADTLRRIVESGITVVTLSDLQVYTLERWRKEPWAFISDERSPLCDGRDLP